MYFVSCARILARCHIQIVYSRRQQPTDLPRNEMQAQLLLPLLLLVLPPLLLYLAACPSIWQRHCAGVRYSNDIWICAYTRILPDSLFVLQGRQFVVARTSYTIGDCIMRCLHYALTARARAAAADAPRINMEFDFEYIRNSKTELAQVVTEIGISVLAFGL